MPTIPQQIPTSLFDLYDLQVQDPIPMLDESGEDCRYCQSEDVYVQVQAYATHAETGEPIVVSCCCLCLGQALFLADADMLEPVVVEYERSTVREGGASLDLAGMIAGER
jgi:hypothetical protein